MFLISLDYDFIITIVFPAFSFIIIILLVETKLAMYLYIIMLRKRDACINLFKIMVHFLKKCAK